MRPDESVSVSTSHGGHGHPGEDIHRTVVWVRGEHDVASREHLTATIARAARVDDADLVIDLSGVTFMDASTIGALVVSRNLLTAHSRLLTVRAPSPFARRVLGLGGLSFLTDEHPAPAQPPVTSALGSWVDVPAGDRAPDAAPTVHEGAPSQEPARATAQRPIDPAASVEQPRAPS